MPEKINIAQQLDCLIKLQDVDAQIYKLKAEKETKPEEIKQLKDSLAREETTLKDVGANLKSLQLKRKEKEMDLEGKETEVKKLQTQLYQIKTNKEYTAMLHEIEAHRADNSLLEEEILKLMESVDTAQAKVQEEKKKLEDLSKNVDTEVRKIEDRVKEIDAALTELKSKREEITPTIDPQILKNYDRILDGREGSALVDAVNDACGGCYMHLPPQIINEIKMEERIIYCENCQRMLYIKDDSA